MHDGLWASWAWNFGELCSSRSLKFDESAPVLTICSFQRGGCPDTLDTPSWIRPWVSELVGFYPPVVDGAIEKLSIECFKGRRSVILRRFHQVRRFNRVDIVFGRRRRLIVWSLWEPAFFLCRRNRSSELVLIWRQSLEQCLSLSRLSLLRLRTIFVGSSSSLPSYVANSEVIFDRSFSRL